jgi:hypothetical protein
MLDSVLNRSHTPGLGGEVVRGDEDGLGAGSLALLGHGLQVVEVPSDERQLAAESGEVDGGASADTGTRPGDRVSML